LFRLRSFDQTMHPRRRSPLTVEPNQDSFQEKILVEVQAKSVVIKSTDSKAASLIKKYGDKIFGLNKENSIDYSWDVMGPIAIRNIKKKIL